MKQDTLLTPKSLDPNLGYEATVVDENDPQKFGRIRARVKGLMDAIPDTDLAWCRPKDWVHPFGLKGGQTVGATSSFGGVPRRGNKVMLYFPTKNMYQAVYSGAVPLDNKNRDKAYDINYPNRVGFKYPNGLQIIADTQTNELFFINAGDMNITIFGDVNQTIVGNQQLIVSGSKSDIPSYILNDPNFTAKNLKPSPTTRIPFKGLLGKMAGSQHTVIKGNQTVEVHGSKKEKIHGNYQLEVGKSVSIKAGGAVDVNGTTIDLN